MATGFPVKGTGGATTYSANSVLSSSDLNDGFGSLNLLFNAQNSAGKNVIINGGMDIWQRGTTSTANTTYTTADRWYCYSNATTFTWSQNSTAPTGLRYSLSGTVNSGSGTCQFQHPVETANTIPLAGQTATLSFYAATTGPTGQAPSLQFSYSTAVDAGMGGSYTAISGTTNYFPAISGSFQRYSVTYTIPSTAKSLQFLINSNSTMTTGQSFSLAGVQLELGSVATPFSRAGGSIGGELALCRRYYWRETATAAYTSFGQGLSSNTTQARILIQTPGMRTMPSSTIEFGNLGLYDGTAMYPVTGMGLAESGSDSILFTATVASGLTQYRGYNLLGNNSTSAYVGFSAEL